MEYRVRSGAARYKLSLDVKGDLSEETEVEVGKNLYKIRVHERYPTGEPRLVSINNKLISVKVQRREDGFPYRVILNGTAYPVEIERVAATRYRPPASERQASTRIHAALPGQISRTFVTPGSKVKAGQSLLILEAMKMENEIIAPRDGTIKTLAVKPKQLVAKGDLLLELEG